MISQTHTDLTSYESVINPDSMVNNIVYINSKLTMDSMSLNINYSSQLGSQGELAIIINVHVKMTVIQQWVSYSLNAVMSHLSSLAESVFWSYPLALQGHVIIVQHNHYTLALTCAWNMSVMVVEHVCYGCDTYSIATLFFRKHHHIMSTQSFSWTVTLLYAYNRFGTVNMTLMHG